jgi:hypothetical protein
MMFVIKFHGCLDHLLAMSYQTRVHAARAGLTVKRDTWAYNNQHVASSSGTQQHPFSGFQSHSFDRINRPDALAHSQRMTAQLLAAELGNLIQDAKRKNTELKNAAEIALKDLKSLPNTSDAQLSAGEQTRCPIAVHTLTVSKIFLDVLTSYHHSC